MTEGLVARPVMNHQIISSQNFALKQQPSKKRCFPSTLAFQIAVQLKVQ
jgi:hypothetical protein